MNQLAAKDTKEHFDVVVIGAGQAGLAMGHFLARRRRRFVATGYRPDYSWIDLPVLDADGRARHRRGLAEVPGLYFLGLSWQHTRGSALLGWVKDDAEFVAAQIDASAQVRPGPEGRTPESEGARAPRAAGATQGA